MSEEIKADLVIQLNVECPNCGDEFDLAETRFNDEGQLYDQVLPDDRWVIDERERLETPAQCLKCSAEFYVKGVNW